MKDVLIITSMKCSIAFNAGTELPMHTSTEVSYGSSLEWIDSIEWIMIIKKVEEWQQGNTKKYTTLQYNTSVMHSARNSLG
jgi:hypothetical protein